MQKGEIAGPVLYLWRPSPVITIGRHQNPWKECKLAQMEEEGVALVRRRSGGGAVFQDPGCSVFTFLDPSKVWSMDRNFNVVIGGLRRLGITAERQGRNDLTVDGKKMSGSAFKHGNDPDVSLHHGTLLVDTDMSALSRYLTPDKRKLQAKGIASVGARVANLRALAPSLTHDDICNALISEFCSQVGAQDIPVEEIDASSSIAQNEAFRRYRAEIADDEWRLGRTPEFSHQLDTRIDGVGVFDVRLQVTGGVIDEVAIFSDALYPDVIDQLIVSLKGVEYGRRGLSAAFQDLHTQVAEGGPRQMLDAFAEWVLSEVDA